MERLRHSPKGKRAAWRYGNVEDRKMVPIGGNANESSFCSAADATAPHNAQSRIHASACRENTVSQCVIEAVGIASSNSGALPPDTRKPPELTFQCYASQQRNSGSKPSTRPSILLLVNDVAVLISRINHLPADFHSFELHDGRITLFGERVVGI